MTVNERIAILNTFTRIDLISYASFANTKLGYKQKTFICAVPTSDLIGIIINYELSCKLTKWSN